MGQLPVAIPGSPVKHLQTAQTPPCEEIGANGTPPHTTITSGPSMVPVPEGSFPRREQREAYVLDTARSESLGAENFSHAQTLQIQIGPDRPPPSIMYDERSLAFGNLPH